MDNSPGIQNQSGDHDSLVIARLCEQYVRTRQAGNAPTVSEFAASHPDVSGPLLNALNAMELLGSFQPPRSRRTDTLPKQIAGCEVLREIGRGGMGVVYEARHPTVSRRLAIKLLHNRRGLQKSFRERFRREAETTSRLSHPNIVPFIDCGEHEGTPFISMLYVSGKSLDCLLEHRWGDGSDEELTPSSAFIGKDFSAIAKIGADAAAALEHAHQQNAIHRDIKPANLILDQDGKVWVADFGLAKLRDEDDGLSETGDIIGTPRYMAPEQIRGLSDERSDIYSVGVTLWELATGRRAWENIDGGDMLAKKSATLLPDVRSINPEVPIALARIISRCCEFKPKHRFQSAEQLHVALSAFVGTSDSGPREDVSSSRAAATTVSLLIAMLLVAFLLINRRDTSNVTEFGDSPLSESYSAAIHTSQTMKFVVEEGQVEVPGLRLTASNSDGDDVYWQLVNSRDSALFVCQKLSGTVCFVDPPSHQQPLDSNRDNAYELEFEAVSTWDPHVLLVVESDLGFELWDPRTGKSTSVSLPKNLQAIGASDVSKKFFTHFANDGSIALFRSAGDSSMTFPSILNSNCGLSPFVRDIACSGVNDFIALEETENGTELRRLVLDDSQSFRDVGFIDGLEFVDNPIGICQLSPNDLLILGTADSDSKLLLFEAAILRNKVLSHQELPVGWAIEHDIRGMVAWQTSESSAAPIQDRRLVIVRVESTDSD